MGYMHIANAYKEQDFLLFKELFASEKVHGTSAHVSWKDNEVHFFSGGEKHDNFVKLFDAGALKSGFEAMGHPEVVIFGEAYGGKQQGQSWRYGTKLCFIAFEVKVGDCWLDQDNAAQVAVRMCLEFVPYKRIPATLEAIDAERDAPSEVAKRRGIVEDKPREGVVLRPLKEFKLNDGSRVICKHKRAEERETTKPRDVGDPAKLAVLEAADDIANEWVTPTRLQHVLDKLDSGIGLKRMKDVIEAMVEDVTREGKGEIVDSKDARKAIGKRTADLFRKHVQGSLYEPK